MACLRLDLLFYLLFHLAPEVLSSLSCACTDTPKGDEADREIRAKIMGNWP
jgi:hypothetical protein